LNNACKFTPKTGTIVIRGYWFFGERRSPRSALSIPVERRRQVVADQPNSYRIDISDSAPAIPAEHLDRIFEEYTSYADGRDRSAVGWDWRSVK
jgi:signal transduction histidine kinase